MRQSESKTVKLYGSGNGSFEFYPFQNKSKEDILKILEQFRSILPKGYYVELCEHTSLYQED